MNTKEKQKQISDILSECVIKLEQLNEEKTFEKVDVKSLISVMDNAVFYMEAEIKEVSGDLIGEWSLLPNN